MDEKILKFVGWVVLTNFERGMSHGSMRVGQVPTLTKEINVIQKKGDENFGVD